MAKNVDKKQSALAEVKKKLEAMKKKKGGGDYPYNYLTIAPDTKAIVRIFPWGDRPNDEFYLERQEYKFDGKVSAAWDGKGEDPIAKIMNERRKKGLELQKKDKKKGQTFLKEKVDPLKPRERYYANAAVLTKEGPVQTGKNAGDPLKKAELWEFGPQVMQQILTIMVDEDAEVNGDFLDPKTAYDFVVKRDGDGLATEWTVSTTRKYVKVDTSDVETHDIEAVVKPAVSSKELLALFNGEEVETDEDEDEDDIDDSKVGSSKKKPSKKKDDDEEDEDEDSDEEEDDADEDEDESDDEDEDEDEDESDDEDESEDEDSDDEDDADEDEDEDESDDESDDEDEDSDEEEDDADEDEDEDESDDEDEDESDDEDEDEDESDDDEDDADEDEDEKPSKKKPSKKSPPAKKGASQKAAPKKKK